MSKMLSDKNQVMIASAGSRKTTFIVEKALQQTGKRILITTYTNENLDQIRKYFIERCGCVPSHVTLLSWYSFLLQDCIRPYQSYVTSENRRARSIIFTQLSKWNQRTPKNRADAYYLTTGNDVYRDRVSDLACACNNASNGLVIKRLEKIYTAIFIDEVQDLAGYDLELLGKLFASSITVTVVGDPRQGTFTTNNGQKNKQYRKSAMLLWISKQQENGVVNIVEKNECYRCNQTICDFADKLFPEFGKTTSFNKDVTGHDGIFLIKPLDVVDYVKKYNPAVLRWDKRTNTMQLPAINFGASKGRTYDRVLIFPTQPMIKFLETKDSEDAGDRAKFYVAATRAKYSVAFVID